LHDVSVPDQKLDGFVIHVAGFATKKWSSFLCSPCLVELLKESLQTKLKFID